MGLWSWKLQATPPQPIMLTSHLEGMVSAFPDTSYTKNWAPGDKKVDDRTACPTVYHLWRYCAPLKYVSIFHFPVYGKTFPTLDIIIAFPLLPRLQQLFGLIVLYSSLCRMVHNCMWMHFFSHCQIYSTPVLHMTPFSVLSISVPACDKILD